MGGCVGMGREGGGMVGRGLVGGGRRREERGVKGSTGRDRGCGGGGEVRWGRGDGRVR